MIRNKQQGLSLIELMISMLIGLFLIGGLITSLFSTTKLDKSRQAISEIESNANIALESIRQSVSHAGYRSTRNTRLEKAFYSTEDGELTNPTCRGSLKRDIDGQTPTKSHWTQDSSRTDTLTVVSLADNPCLEGNSSCPNASDANPSALIYIDCADGGRARDARAVSCSTDIDVGMITPTEAKLFNTFKLDTTENTLVCEGNRGGSITLADNVYAMQFLYGVTSSDGSTRYKNASSVESNSEWGLVKSVQVALLMESSEENVFDTDNTVTQYALLDTTITIPDNRLRRLYRVYSTTINLANQN